MSTCLQIIDGMVPGINRLATWPLKASTNRAEALKGHMEQFGQVDLVHMGNRQNPEDEPPKAPIENPKMRIHVKSREIT